MIASHANEAAPRSGVLQPNTKTATFLEATDTPVYLPLSGHRLSFNGDGICTAGCGEAE
ncbi:hypothetical protein XM38_039460 [Halomicronema hongdechloris C2206]|uniref:Uncharacterized protein n=1 Tax=Halomicronema hongdechloris C2206 TaxID=1641165 RepID=A0A1Z3HRS7_9CYAN|nr:hypothetical protein [Halomicronema hongdechloris]ASC72985.1 hypothetical protein XM38_039460 [Halomicronema hongdechloris C2206]